MFMWLKRYSESYPQTRYFVLNALIYGLAIVITTIYCYGRLDFVRSYRTPAVIEAEQKKKALQQQKQPLETTPNHKT